MLSSSKIRECRRVIYFLQTPCVLKQRDLQKSLVLAFESVQVMPSNGGSHFGMTFFRPENHQTGYGETAT